MSFTTEVLTSVVRLCHPFSRVTSGCGMCSQPALYVAGLAAVEKLRGEDAAAVEECGAVAGLSLGEYCALVFAGALSFEDGLKVAAVLYTVCMPMSE